MSEKLSEEEVRSLYSILRKIDFLSTITVEDVDVVIESFEKLTLGAGKTVIKQGVSGKGLYIIKTGSCRVVKEKGWFKKEDLAVIGAGNFFGEMSLIYDNPVSATVETLEPSEIYFYAKDDFVKLALKNDRLKAQLKKIADKRTSENILGK